MPCRLARLVGGRSPSAYRRERAAYGVLGGHGHQLLHLQLCQWSRSESVARRQEHRAAQSGERFLPAPRARRIAAPGIGAGAPASPRLRLSLTHDHCSQLHTRSGELAYDAMPECPCFHLDSGFHSGAGDGRAGSYERTRPLPPTLRRRATRPRRRAARRVAKAAAASTHRCFTEGRDSGRRGRGRERGPSATTTCSRRASILPIGTRPFELQTPRERPKVLGQARRLTRRNGGRRGAFPGGLPL